MPNRLLINAKWQAHPAPTGVQRYAQGLIHAMRQGGIQFDEAIPPTTSRWRTTVWEQRSLPNLARNYDTLLCPSNMAPLNLDDSVRLLLTLHCLRFRFHPQNYAPSFVRWYAFAIPRLIERAESVFTVSQAQQTEIESVYPQSVGKIRVMYPGVDRSFRPDHRRDLDAPSEPYLVYIGSAAPAKNLSTLLNAFGELNDAPELVLIGVDRTQADLISPSTLRDRLIPLGHLNDPARISALLAHADALLSPSRYESFGLPCLEAMSSGCPVIASDLPAHREVCQDAALFVDPNDPSAWASAIQLLLSDDSRRARLREAGLARSKQFRWAHAVTTLKQILARSGKATV